MDFNSLKSFLNSQNISLVLASDAEPRVEIEKGREAIPAGGVGISLEPIAKAAGAIYIARAKTKEDKKHKETSYADSDGGYRLKRVVLSDQEFESYYNGFANQTIWPLSHVAFERPEFKKDWYEGFLKVNKKFAEQIDQAAKNSKKPVLVWLNDFHLCLVPSLLKEKKECDSGYVLAYSLANLGSI